MLARQVPYHLSHTPILPAFGFSYFSDRVSCFFVMLDSDRNPLAYAFHIGGITGVSHHG
jgi:hypothetical protein